MDVFFSVVAILPYIFFFFVVESNSYSAVCLRYFFNISGAPSVYTVYDELLNAAATATWMAMKYNIIEK